MLGYDGGMSQFLASHVESEERVMTAISSSPSKRRPRVSAPLLFLLFSTGLLITTLAAAFPPGSDAAPRTLPELPRGSRIPWQDGSYFLSGVNYPYYRYYGGDIATLSFVDPDCNWTYDNSFNYAGIDADFADMQARGVHVVRWWLFG